MQPRSAQVPQPELHGSSGAKTGAIRMTITNPRRCRIVPHILPCNSPSLSSLHYNVGQPDRNSTSRREIFGIY